MFKKKFKHDEMSTRIACGFTDDDPFAECVKAMLNVFCGSNKFSEFVETIENQILHDVDVPDSVRMGVRILILTIIPQMKELRKLHELQEVLPQLLKGGDPKDIEKSLDKFKEWMMNELEKSNRDKSHDN